MDTQETVSPKRKRELQVTSINGVYQVTLSSLPGQAISFEHGDIPNHILDKFIVQGITDKFSNGSSKAETPEARWDMLEQVYEQVVQSGTWATKIIGDGVNKRSKDNLVKKMSNLSEQEQSEMLALMAKMGVQLDS